VDDRSEKAIATLLPQVQPYARALVKKAAQHGITIKVIAGMRTYDEQNELFTQGRTKPGRIVTKAELERLVLGFESELASNAIEVHVSSLRKKLGRDLVETVRGMGYRVGGPA